MRKLLAILLLPSLSYANPFVVSDPLPAGVTQCGVFLDALAKTTVPVTAVSGGNICKVDIGNVTVGSHTISLTSITVNDPIWGSLESAKSAPLSFTRPGVPNAPTGLVLQP